MHIRRHAATACRAWRGVPASATISPTRRTPDREARMTRIAMLLAAALSAMTAWSAAQRGRARSEDRRLHVAEGHQVDREYARRQPQRGAAGRSVEARSLRDAAHLAAGEHEPPAFPSERSLLHGALGHLVGRQWRQVRSRGDRADAGRHARDPLGQGRAFRRRQDRAGDDPGVGRRAGDQDAVRGGGGDGEEADFARPACAEWREGLTATSRASVPSRRSAGSASRPRALCCALGQMRCSKAARPASG